MGVIVKPDVADTRHYRTCDSAGVGKRGYLTSREAKRARGMIRTRVGGSNQEVYRCGQCHRWHIGISRNR